MGSNTLQDFFEHMEIENMAWSSFDVKLFRETYNKGLQKKEEAYNIFISKIKEKNDSELLDFYEGSNELIHSCDNIFDQLCIVGLYVSLENYLKFILKRRWQIDASRANFITIKEKFKKQQINFEQFESYELIDDLRMYNNCIKHSDCRVSRELSKKHQELIENEKLHISEQIIKTFTKETEKFRLYLVKRIYMKGIK